MSFEACLEIVKAQDYDRYLACLFVKPEHRAPLTALYAFNCELGRIRESVSDPMLGEIRLTWWREALDEISEGAVRKHPVVEALAETLRHHDLPMDVFHTMIDARVHDLYEAAPEDMAALLDYAQATGGGLLSLAAQICGASQAQRDIASSLGTGVALVGIVRSIAFHGQIRRVHLPADALAEQGLSADHIFQGEFGPEIKTLAKGIGEKAQEHLAKLKDLAAPSSVRRAIVPAIFARDYLARSFAADFDPFIDVSQRGSAKRLFLAWRYCHFAF